MSMLHHPAGKLTQAINSTHNQVLKKIDCVLLKQVHYTKPRGNNTQLIYVVWWHPLLIIEWQQRNVIIKQFLT